MSFSLAKEDMDKYEKWYNSLIDHAKKRAWLKKTAPCYVERHHVIPKSLGGSNDSNNLVYLTAREHAIAHMILCRFGDKNQRIRMTNALQRFMSSNKSISSIMYESCRKRYSDLMSMRLRGNTYRLGKIDSEETRKKKSVPGKGGTWKRTDNHKKECSERAIKRAYENNPMNNEESRKKVGLSKIGKKKYTNQLTGESKMFLPGTELIGWSR